MKRSSNTNRSGSRSFTRRSLTPHVLLKNELGETPPSQWADAQRSIIHSVNCVACGPTISSASNEHVFSKWLLKEFEPNASMPLYRQFDDGTHKQARAEIKL